MAVSLNACLAASVTVSPHLGDVWLQAGSGWLGSNRRGCLVQVLSNDLLSVQFGFEIWTTAINNVT